MFGVQGRHLSPLINGPPLLLAHRWRPTGRGRLVVAASWAGMCGLAGVFALRRYAGGSVPGNFFDAFAEPLWTPVFGVVPTLLALGLALAAVAWVCTVAPPLGDDTWQAVDQVDRDGSVLAASAAPPPDLSRDRAP